MSGHNGIKKYARVNRNDQVLNLQTIGATASFARYTVPAGTVTLSADSILKYGTVAFDATSPAAVAFPSALAFRKANDGSYMSLQIGSCVKVMATNTDAVAKSITFPGTIVEDIPPRTTTMRTCDNTNVISLPACSAVEFNVCMAGPENFVATPIGVAAAAGAGITQIINEGIGAGLVDVGIAPVATVRSIVGGTGIVATQNATDVTITSTTTQQIAYDNSKALVDDPTILIDDAAPYEFKVQEGSIRTGNQKLDTKRDINGTSVIDGITRMAAVGTYYQRPGRPVNAPNYATESEFSRNKEKFTDTANVATAGGIGVRDQFENSNFSTGLHGSKTEGRPMVTDTTPSIALGDPLIVRGDGSWTPFPLNGRTPDDPNTGWKVDNYSYRALVLADNTTAAPPTAVDGGVAAWSQFGINHGISPWNVQLFNYPADTHFAPNLNEYHLGGFILQNGPVNGNANPATTTIDLSKNLSMTYWTGGTSVERMASYFEIHVTALEYRNVGNTISYKQSYAYTYSNDAAISIGNLQLIHGYQSNNNPATHPPPNISVGGDPRFNLSLVWNNGANQGAVNNRKFFVQIYVRAQWQAIFNPTV